MSGITTHILDTARGRPAAGVPVLLEARASGEWKQIAKSVTNADGRVTDLIVSGAALARGTYRLSFDVAEYFRGLGVETFYPEVNVTFEVRNPGDHYHVPLLLSPCGYTTYRGS